MTGKEGGRRAERGNGFGGRPLARGESERYSRSQKGSVGEQEQEQDIQDAVAASRPFWNLEPNLSSACTRCKCGPKVEGPGPDL